MNRDQAYTQVKQTFTHGFDAEQFRNFVINLLNHVDISKAQSWNSQYVKGAFKEHVQRYERLGTYTSPSGEKLDLLVVYLTSATKLERARTAIRNFVADHLKTRDEKDAALVAFVSPLEKQWRFSYVKMEYATFVKESGKVGVETRLTPARRFSYIVGEGESCHTAQTRFFSLLQDTKTDPTLAVIEEAFSVEAVTAEFFKCYVELFEGIHYALEQRIQKDKSIRDEFQEKNINAVDFSKKLMGQVVFLYFLQKKGWLGVENGHAWGTGPRDFLRRLAKGEYGKYSNFFNDVLEPLFYDTLATDRGHDAWCDHFKCRIPFLNGGLFEPLSGYNWRTTNILLPNHLFLNDKFVEEGITGTGVLDVFDRYNFTVNEAEPLEKEVAIDPEMLGKVFENLIEENRRKGLGSYYTPREIVHYMCQESLINYLDTVLNTESQLVPRDDIENFIYLGEQISHYESVDTKYPIKMPATIESNARLIDANLAEITVCDPAVGSGAFPVGMMAEIVHGRCALTPYFNAVQERTPYHFKRHAIQNCLYGVDIDPGAVEIAKLRLWLSLVVDEEDVKQIKPLPNLDYKIVTGNSILGFPFKSQRVTAIESLKQQFFDEYDQEKKAALKSQIDEQLRAAFVASKKTLGYDVSFDFEIFFSEVFYKGGFDIVIANPPYVSYGLRGAQKMSQQEKDLLKQLFPDSAEYKISLYAIFMDKAIQLAKVGGVQTLIVPDSFLMGRFFSKIRSLILRKNKMIELLVLPYGVFDTTVGFSIVYLFQRSDSVNASCKVVTRYIDSKDKVMNKTLRTFSYPQDYFKTIRYNRFRLFFDETTMNLISKISSGTTPLGDIIDFNSGLIAKGGKDSIVATEKLNKYWLPGLSSGGEIRRFVLKPKGYYILYQKDKIHSGYDCVDYFTDKLFMRQTGDSLICAIDDIHLLCLNNVHVGNLKDDDYSLKYIAALINSKLLNYYYRSLALESGRAMAQTDIETIEELPIKKMSRTYEIQIIELVDNILAITKDEDYLVNSTKQDRVNGLEFQIDQMIYEIYDLTHKEITSVKGKAF